MIRLREFTQAEAEIFVHPEEKDHPNFSRYADYKMPLWGIAQQEKEVIPSRNQDRHTASPDPHDRSCRKSSPKTQT